MRIREIRAVGLRGGTPEGGWTNEIRPEDCVHTLVAVLTDEGPYGLGSVFAGEDLVRAAIRELEPLYRGENPLSPERLSEKLHQNTFWLGRGGTLTHAISGIDIALWDLFGKVTGQPVGVLLGGRYRERVRPYASLLMQEPAALAEYLLGFKAQGFNAFKMGWGPFGRVSAAMDEAEGFSHRRCWLSVTGTDDTATDRDRAPAFPARTRCRCGGARRRTAGGPSSARARPGRTAGRRTARAPGRRTREPPRNRRAAGRRPEAPSEPQHQLWL